MNKKAIIIWAAVSMILCIAGFASWKYKTMQDGVRNDPLYRIEEKKS